jgi:sphinganine-1-phosphate aldolase
MENAMTFYPYADRYEVVRGLPSEGRPRQAILAELREMAELEDAKWEGGKASGSFYCGDHEHYEFMGEAYSMYSHMNAMQRDVCPSATRFEGEIIAMGLDLMHASAVTDCEPAGMLTSGGSGSILHAMLAYREQATANGIARANIVKPETAHPAFDKACHLLGLEMRRAPIDPVTAQVDVAAMASMIDADTAAIVGSACNYGYGTIDPIDQLSALALDRGVGLHVDGCLGGWLLPFGEQLGFDIPVFDFRHPGVTTISADTHKYGYSVKGTSILMFRDKELRNGQYFFLTDWSGGKYASPGIDGSRSSGLLAATWASLVSLGREGYLKYAKQIFDTAYAMQEAVRAHSELRIIGSPSFCFSFTSDEFDIYHVNDAMKERGWRLNGQQYPNAIHMAVTRPQTQDGVLEAWQRDLPEAVAYANQHRHEPAQSSSIYGGAVTPTAEVTAKINSIITGLLDTYQSVPPAAQLVDR